MRTTFDDTVDRVFLAFVALAIVYALSECAFGLTHGPEEAAGITHPEGNVILYPILESSWFQ